MRTLEQQRAAYAWEKLRAPVKKEFVNLAKGAPALVMTNGLVQFLGFLLAKDEGHKRLANIVVGWLRKRGIVAGGQNGAGNNDVNDALERLLAGDARQYMRATEEALEILRWVRTLADARFKQNG